MVNMNEILEECKKRFPIGSQIRNTDGLTCTLHVDNVIYEIHDEAIWANAGLGCLYDNGKWAEVISLPESKQIYFPDLSQHIGRYVKALVNSPNGGAVAKGEYGKIVSYRTLDFPRHEGYHASEALTEIYLNKGYELMPEGFIPIDDSQEKEHPLVSEARRLSLIHI
jgi:hypothetical protein